MRIAISAEGKNLSSRIDPRFGRAKWLIFYETDSGTFEAINNMQVLNLPQGAGIQAAQHVIDGDVEVVLTGHCGPNAFKALSAGKVQVVIGATGTVLDAINRFEAGELEPARSPDVEGHW